MKCVYVGICTPGTTSQLRFSALQRVLPTAEWLMIDTGQQFQRRHRIWRSLAFRLGTGPAVTSINRQVLGSLPKAQFDLVWVDKGVFLWPATVQRLRSQADRLVYYTPDTSFLHNRSRFFEQTIGLYDRVVTTKSLELPLFYSRMKSERLLLTMQSWDARLHYPRVPFHEKRAEAVLIGLCEPSREQCVSALLDAGVPVRIGGQGWGKFLRRHGRRSGLEFEGERVFGEQYAHVLSRASIGLGLVTKRFPELHTTRTFEIPACGTALATEQNSETTAIFGRGDVLFFSNTADLAVECRRLLAQSAELETMSVRGRNRVLCRNFDNDGMVKNVLASCEITVTSASL